MFYYFLIGTIYTIFTVAFNDYVIKNGGDERDRITILESLILFFAWPIYVILTIVYLFKNIEK